MKQTSTLQHIAKTEPYRALSMGVVARAKKDLDGTDVYLCHNQTDEVRPEELYPWLRRAGWPTKWADELVRSHDHE